MPQKPAVIPHGGGNRQAPWEHSPETLVLQVTLVQGIGVQKGGKTN